MRFFSVLALVAIVGKASGHGVVHSVTGANGAMMPGLSVRDGTVRNNGFPTSGSEDDTSVIRKTEIGRRATVLGRSPKGGPVRAENAMVRYMGMGPEGMGPIARQMLADGRQPLFQVPQASMMTRIKRQLNPLGLANLFGVGPAIRAPAETMQRQTDGLGMMMGMPTTRDNGMVDMVVHQVNQDGAGPYTVEIDPASVGTNDRAFQRVQVAQNVPGLVLGLSLESSRKFPLRAMMNPGTTCQGSMMGMQNVCVLRAKNGAPAGPFGGSVMFTQSPEARRRALEYNEKKKREASKRAAKPTMV